MTRIFPMFWTVPIAAVLSGSLLTAQAPIAFKVHALNLDSEFSAATAIDINGDGAVDIVCGAFWYEAAAPNSPAARAAGDGKSRLPTWKRHRFREVEQIRGRFDDYSNLPLDVDEDGNIDIVSVNYRSQSLYWCRNPGAEESRSGGVWEKLVIDTPGPSETGRLVDIDGDGRLDVLPNGMNFAAWYSFSNRAGQGTMWSRHELPSQLAGHGIGAGDVNGDGRVDVIGTRGWAEAPEDPREGRWRWHSEFRLAGDSGLPILCHDVDGDGDNDLIWARGHNIGLYWTEQVGDQESSIRHSPGDALWNEVQPQVARSKWITHAIDTSWACGHTLMLADIDGDGVDDLVAGKRYLGHDGKDPGENDPLSIYWYRFDSSSKTWERQTVSYGGRVAIDLDSACVDLDGDGDIDIIAPSRAGLHWLENLGPGGDFENVATADSSSAREISGAESVDPMQLGAIEGEEALEHGRLRQQILRQMEQVMGPLPSSERRIALDVEIESVEDAGKYARLKLNYAAEPGDRVPAYLLVPHGIEQPRAAVLCLHPTHFELGKSQICGLGGQPSRFYAHELAEAGFVCLAPDYPGFGDYDYDFAGDLHRDRYVSGTMKAIWNNIRALDLLESLPSVDRDALGVIGHSLGGHNALFTAAFDLRARCVVTSCGFNAFEDYYGGDLKGWTSDRYMPHIAARYDSDPQKMPFDFSDVLIAIAPRPLFVNAPLHDSNFAVEGVRKCEAHVRPVLELLGQPDAFRFEYPDAEHDFPQPVRQIAYEWLEKHLR